MCVYAKSIVTTGGSGRNSLLQLLKIFISQRNWDGWDLYRLQLITIREWAIPINSIEPCLLDRSMLYTHVHIQCHAKLSTLHHIHTWFIYNATGNSTCTYHIGLSTFWEPTDDEAQQSH